MSDLSDLHHREWRPMHIQTIDAGLAGCLIAVEGIDGSGKSTLTERLRERFVQEGKDCLVLRALSDSFREYGPWRQWHDRPDRRSEQCELGLTIMALGDRLCHQKGTVMPALERGAVVIVDRYVLSVLSFWSTPVHEWALERLLTPHLGVYLRVPPDLAHERIKATRDEPEELYNLENLKLLSARYDSLAPLNNYQVLDGQLDVDELVKLVVRYIS